MSEDKSGEFGIDVPGYGVVDLATFGIDEEQILDELSEHAGFYAFWYSQENMAYRVYQEERLQTKIIRATRHKYYRSVYDWSEDYDKRPTNDDVKALVESDEEVIKVEEALIQARFKYQQIRAVREALQQRKDMLNSVSGIKRTEMTFGQRGGTVT